MTLIVSRLNLATQSQNAKQRQQENKHRIQLKGANKISVQQLVQRSRRAAAGTIPSGERMEKATRIKGILRRVEKVERHENSNCRQSKKQPDEKFSLSPRFHEVTCAELL